MFLLSSVFVFLLILTWMITKDHIEASIVKNSYNKEVLIITGLDFKVISYRDYLAFLSHSSELKEIKKVKKEEECATVNNLINNYNLDKEDAEKTAAEEKLVYLFTLPLGAKFRFPKSQTIWVLLNIEGNGLAATWEGSGANSALQKKCHILDREEEDDVKYVQVVEVR